MKSNSDNRSEPPFDRRRAGLLVVDMQGFFLSPKSPAFLPAAQAILRRIRSLVEGFRAAGRPVAFAVYKTPKNGPMVRRWRKVCRGNSALALPPDFQPLKGEKLFVKGSYSAFRGTGCSRWLKSRGVKNLVICGIKTNLCVESSVRDAFDLGYEVYVPSDACATNDKTLHLGSLRNMAAGFAEISKSDTVIQGCRVR